MKKNKEKGTLTFRQAVEATPDISFGYKSGLSALGPYSNKIEVSDTTQLQGSVDIDNCTKAKYPSENRWDYALAYKSEIVFVEVHSAKTSEVRTMLKKLHWLKDWLIQKAPEMNKLRGNNSNPFIWIQSKNFQIPKSSPQYFAVKSRGLLPVRKLELI